MKRYLLFLPFLISTMLYGQTTTPKYSNEFLAIGVGARALGMSNAVVSSSNDVSAGYWNPSSLVNSKQEFSVAAMHASYFAGIANYDYAAFSANIDTGSSIGVSIIRFAVDDIPDTRFLYDASGNINYDRIQFFSAADYGFLISYARKLHAIPNLSYGANFKLIYRNVGEFASAWGFGLDASISYDYNKWSLGMIARDITGTFNAWSHNSSLVADIYSQTDNEIPESTVEVTLPSVRIGISRQFIVKQKFGILAEIDGQITFDGKRNTLVKSETASLAPIAGLELDYLKKVYLRFGIGNFQEIKDFDGSTSLNYQPNFGVGIAIKNFHVDYALTDLGNQSEALYSHVFSLKYGWDSK